MEDGLKNKAYLLAMRLYRAQYHPTDIIAHLTDIGLTEDEAKVVLNNILLQTEIDREKAEEPFTNIALFKVGIGILACVVIAIIFPEKTYIPIGMIVTGLAYLLFKKLK
jgi:hypothetical protein